MKTFAITTGEPAGIGPEITIQALLQVPLPLDVQCCVIGDAQLLTQRAQMIGQAPSWEALCQQGQVNILPVSLTSPCVPGQLNIANASYVVSMLDKAITGCMSGEFCAMVTAPVQKSIIAQAGIPFTGHTEYLAQQSGTAKVVMMLAGRQSARVDDEIMRVALATTHIPLSRVASSLSCEGLLHILRIIDHDLRTRFGIATPRILVAGLNPHAGEQGQLGREEIDIITPALARATEEGILVQGPLPADTLFQPRYLAQADCVLAMYHDQGLAPLKYATFGHGINITLGLPFIRTSVDHGTALDMAGSGQAVATSMCAAIDMALTLSYEQP
ncbi:MAG: 4-hydroxythreonine-4-phosphate dehydrogenase PdxA [Ottowia sp.]|nr:4-hydroxythreonine-4-phosphate dehydrogenase PdxA [Ottowia sp.]